MTLDLSACWFDPLRPALARVAIDPLPDARALQAAFGDRIAPFRFEPQTHKRGRGALDFDALYEVRIALHGVIPTRTHVHDLMNALVWATFPRSKRALAERQHRALVAQVGERPTQLPNARTRERDVLAMIDEGGVLSVGSELLIFGHAIYEHLGTTDAPVRGFPIVLEAGVELDAAFAARLRTFDASAVRVPALRITRTSASHDPV